MFINKESFKSFVEDLRSDYYKEQAEIEQRMNVHFRGNGRRSDNPGLLGTQGTPGQNSGNSPGTLGQPGGIDVHCGQNPTVGDCRSSPGSNVESGTSGANGLNGQSPTGQNSSWQPESNGSSGQNPSNQGSPASSDTNQDSIGDNRCNPTCGNGGISSSSSDTDEINGYNSTDQNGSGQPDTYGVARQNPSIQGSSAGSSGQQDNSGTSSGSGASPGSEDSDYQGSVQIENEDGKNTRTFFVVQQRSQKSGKKKRTSKKKSKFEADTVKLKPTLDETRTKLTELNLELQKLRQRNAIEEVVWEKAEQFGTHLLDAVNHHSEIVNIVHPQENSDYWIFGDWILQEICSKVQFLQLTTPHWVVLEFLRQQIKKLKVKYYRNQVEYDELELPKDGKVEFAALEPVTDSTSFYHAVSQNVLSRNMHMRKVRSGVQVFKTFGFVKIMKVLLAYDVLKHKELYENISRKYNKRLDEIMLMILSKNEPANHIIIDCVSVLLEKPICVYHRYSDKPHVGDYTYTTTIDSTASASPPLVVAYRCDKESTKEEFYVALLRRDENGRKRQSIKNSIDFNRLAETDPVSYHRYLFLKSELERVS